MATATKANSSARKKVQVKKIIERLEKVHPDAKLDLDFTNPLELLVAFILAAQARDDLVNRVTVDLFKKYRTAEDYASETLTEAAKPDQQNQLLSQQSKSRFITAAGKSSSASMAKCPTSWTTFLLFPA